MKLFVLCIFGVILLAAAITADVRSNFISDRLDWAADHRDVSALSHSEWLMASIRMGILFDISFREAKTSAGITELLQYCNEHPSGFQRNAYPVDMIQGVDIGYYAMPNAFHPLGFQFVSGEIQGNGIDWHYKTFSIPYWSIIAICAAPLIYGLMRIRRNAGRHQNDNLPTQLEYPTPPGSTAP